MGATIGGSLFMYNSTMFAREEEEWVEERYKELCSKYEGITSPNGVRAFKRSMRGLLETAKERADNNGWFIYPGMRRMLKKSWQASIDALDRIDHDDRNAYMEIRDVFKSSGNWKSKE